MLLLFSRRRFLKTWLAALPLAYDHCATAQVVQTAVGSPFSLFANKDFSAWSKQGSANWQIVDGQAVMNQGSGWLISRLPLTDFDLDTEFWLGSQTQASLYIRCVNSNLVNTFISSQTAYQINLGVGSLQDYGPGSIMDLVKAPKLQTGKRWNSLKLSVRGPYLSMWLNGQQVADKAYDTRFPMGPLALNVSDGAFGIRKLNVTIPSRW